MTAHDREKPAFWTGRYERHVTEQMKRYVRTGHTCYDVGAHIGYMTLYLGSLVGTEGKVYAFEPDPRNLEILDRNIKQNHRSNISVIDRPVSNHTTPVRFATYPNCTLVDHIINSDHPAANDAQVVETHAVTMDDVAQWPGVQSPDFIKIDVEGLELEVFQGGLKTIRESRPVIVAEVRDDRREVIGSLMAKEGYSVRQLHSGNPDMENYGVHDLLFVPVAG